MTVYRTEFVAAPHGAVRMVRDDGLWLVLADLRRALGVTSSAPPAVPDGHRRKEVLIRGCGTPQWLVDVAGAKLIVGRSYSDRADAMSAWLGPAGGLREQWTTGQPAPAGRLTPEATVAALKILDQARDAQRQVRELTRALVALVAT